MFERAILPSRSVTGRYWPVVAGFTGESLLVVMLLVSPLVWPQLLPRAQTMSWIMAPAPPPAAVKNAPPVHVRSIKPFQMVGRILFAPGSIPVRAVIFDEPPAGSQSPGVEGVFKAGEVGSVLDAVLRQTPPMLAAEPAVAPPAMKSPPAEPRRISALHPARLLHRVEPVYPLMARQARISGAVELTGVIGTDGRIRELRVVSGPPFLAAAAIEAVRQWAYEPTLLNGDTVEVIAPITVNFRLN